MKQKMKPTAASPKGQGGMKIEKSGIIKVGPEDLIRRNIAAVIALADDVIE